MTHEEMVARFWRRVEKSEGGCWVWIGPRNNHGYGTLSGAGRRHVYAHRFSYEIAHGGIPLGECVLHNCDNPPCVNPAHLWIGSRAQNRADMIAKRRHDHGEAHHNAKLTDVQVAAIRRWFPESGLTQGQLAEMVGVSDSSICLILSGKSRRSVRAA